MPATNNKITFRKKIEIKNKRAEHDYYILQTYTAGIVLYGTEIKSIRAGKAGLTDTFCYIRDGEIWVKNMYVAEYFPSRAGDQEPRPLHRSAAVVHRRQQQGEAQDSAGQGQEGI